MRVLSKPMNSDAHSSLDGVIIQFMKPVPRGVPLAASTPKLAYCVPDSEPLIRHEILKKTITNSTIASDTVTISKKIDDVTITRRNRLQDDERLIDVTGKIRDILPGIPFGFDFDNMPQRQTAVGAQVLSLCENTTNVGRIPVNAFANPKPKNTVPVKDARKHDANSTTSETTQSLRGDINSNSSQATNASSVQSASFLRQTVKDNDSEARQTLVDQSFLEVSSKVDPSNRRYLFSLEVDEG